jgi:hypothetical protein
MTNGVDAAVNTMQATSPYPSGHGVGPDPCFRQLSRTDNTVLMGGDPSDLQIRVGDFFPHTGNNSPIASVRPVDRGRLDNGKVRGI